MKDFSRLERWVIFSLAAIHFTHIMDFMIIMPLGPQFKRIFEITNEQFGDLVSSYIYSAAILNLVGALFLDRFTRKKALLFCYAGHAIATLCCALAPNYLFFLLSRILAGACGGLMQALIFSIVGDTFEFKRRGTATGLLMSAFSLASIFGVPFGLYLANWSDWRAPFYLLAALSIPIWIMAALHLPLQKIILSARESTMQSIRHILTDWNHYRAFLLIGSMMFASFCVIPFLSVSLVANTGFAEKDLPFLYLLGGLFTFFSNPWVGRLTDRYTPLRVFTVMASVSILPVFAVTHLGVVPEYLALIVTTFFMVFVSGRMVPGMTIVLSAVRPEHRASFMSLNTAFQQFGAGIASTVASKIIVDSEGRLENFGLVGWLAVASILFGLFVAPRIIVRAGTV